MRALAHPSGIALFVCLVACADGASAPPPGGWANRAPTVVDTVVDRGDHQLLEVRQGALTAWVQVPDVGAAVGDYVLLGQGTAREDVPVPEQSLRAAQVVDIDHVRVVDEETARRAVTRPSPTGAVPIAQVYAELDQRSGSEVLVYGRVAKATSAVGSVWVHLQDGTGDSAAGTHDLTVQTQAEVQAGQWVGFRGTLRRDVDLGFGYHYDALVEGGTLAE